MLFEALTGVIFDYVSCQYGLEFDQNFSRKLNAWGLPRGVEGERGGGGGHL